MKIIGWVLNKLATLNLYDSYSDDTETTRTEKWSTRLFLCLMLLSTLVLIFYTGLTERVTTKIILNPSASEYKRLLDRSPISLHCWCSESSLNYGSFFDIAVRFHPVCSSRFISNEWIVTVYQANMTEFWPMDIRNWVSSFWQTVKMLCESSRMVMNDFVDDFLSSLLFSPDLMSSIEIQSRTIGSFDLKFGSSVSRFSRTVLTARQIFSNNQFVSGLATNGHFEVFNVSFKRFPVLMVETHSYGNCSCLNSDGCSQPTGFFDWSPRENLKLFEQNSPNRTINGFLFNCFPLDAALSSTLECYFDRNCFSLLHQKSNSSILSIDELERFQRNSTIQELLDDLFIDNINRNVSFDRYFYSCRPSSCNFVKGKRFDLVFILTSLISILGGLITILKFVSPLIVRLVLIVYRNRKRICQWKTQTPVEQVEKPPLAERFRSIVRFVIRKIFELNVFDSNSDELDVIYRQRLSTRIYCLISVISMVSGFVYYIFSTRTRTIVVENPSVETFENLYEKYLDSVRCDCSQLSVLQKDFIDIRYELHQICSSQFLADEWKMNFYYSSRRNLFLTDFMPYAGSYFQMLGSFCFLINQTITDSIRLFQETVFISNQILPRWQFDETMRATIDIFIQTTKSDFIQFFSIIRNSTTANQLLAATSLNGEIQIQPGGRTSSTTRTYLYINTIQSGPSIGVCKCTRGGPLCGQHVRHNETWQQYQSDLQGQYVGCLVMDAVLISSLECWYSRSCVNKVVRWLNEDGLLQPYTVIPLNNQLTSHFTPNTSIDSIMRELFIEQWIQNVSYSNFFDKCAPRACQYSIEDSYEIFYIILALVGIYGGLNKALKLIVPLFVNIIILSWRRIQTRRNIPQRRQLLTRVLSKFQALNLFKTRSSTDETQKQERFATKLYIFVMAVAIIFVLTITSLSERSRFEYLTNPTVDDYEKLQIEHNVPITCPCSRISVPISSAITTIEFSLHPACNSQLIKNSRWGYFFDGAEFTVTWLHPSDFRTWGSSFVIWAEASCSVSQNIILSGLNVFKSATLISLHALTRKRFESEIDERISAFQAGLLKSARQTLAIYRDAIQSNGLMSLFGMNWRWKLDQLSNRDKTRIIHEPVVYNQSCSCATSRQCYKQAAILDYNGSSIFQIDGLVYSCHLIDSYLASSLSCFYSLSCVTSLIASMALGLPMDQSFNPWAPTAITFRIDALDSSLLKSFRVNDTFEKIMNQLFIDAWHIEKSYKSYFSTCAPATCSFEVFDRFNIFYVLTTFLSVYSGLVIVLRLVIPRVVQILLKIRIFRNAVNSLS